MNKTSMLYWWPLVKDSDIPMPKTEIVLNIGPRKWIEFLDGKPLHELAKGWEWLNYCCASGGRESYPFFMRTDLYSGKHNYNNTCKVCSFESIRDHIFQLVDSSFAYDIGLDAIVFRDFIQLEHHFKAFNGLPIAKERRYFAEEGKVYIHHPYWPEDAIKFYKSTSEPHGWKELLREINTESSEEIELLTNYAEQISSKLEGQWSIDFAKGMDGKWYFIDAAEAMKSWIHPDYAIPEGWGQ